MGTWAWPGRPPGAARTHETRQQRSTPPLTADLTPNTRFQPFQRNVNSACFPLSDPARWVAAHPCRAESPGTDRARVPCAQLQSPPRVGRARGQDAAVEWWTNGGRRAGEVSQELHLPFFFDPDASGRLAGHRARLHGRWNAAAQPHARPASRRTCPPFRSPRHPPGAHTLFYSSRCFGGAACESGYLQEVHPEPAGRDLAVLQAFLQDGRAVIVHAGHRRMPHGWSLTWPLPTA